MVAIRTDNLQHRKRKRRKQLNRIKQQMMSQPDPAAVMAEMMEHLRSQGIEIEDISQHGNSPSVWDSVPGISAIREWVRNRREGVPQVPVGMPVDSRVARARTQQRAWYSGIGEAFERLWKRITG